MPIGYIKVFKGIVFDSSLADFYTVKLELNEKEPGKDFLILTVLKDPVSNAKGAGIINLLQMARDYKSDQGTVPSDQMSHERT